MALEGLWEGDLGYLFVQADEDPKTYSSIQALRHDSWWRTGSTRYRIMNDVGRLAATIQLRKGNAPGIDLMEVITANGERGILRRNRTTDGSMLGGLGRYAVGLSFAGILYPDGFVQLLILYGIATVLGFSLLANHSRLGFPYEGFNPARLVFLAALPWTIGYTFYGFKWIFLGWPDPLWSGRIIIIAAGLSLLTLLAVAFHAVHARRRTLKMRPLFWLFLATDVLGLTLNIVSLIQLLDV